ncbi:6-N-hydroxylaminopurine resistance protein, partial [Salmonella enterica subsp. enterica serovar Kentucky]|nr:6-N-hydroxylaminopurine resistance protein [Salmonella enterica subsp. enterica serovar Typhimurium]MDI5417777.1 6-N-hydroxylaminopurine resistance protein [Salmonella enterica subsp. enterica serovar Kentucky]
MHVCRSESDDSLFLYPRKEQQMHYPVDVFIGKIRDYDGSRPSAI